ncbi:ABC transporter ATP-binding protein [Streptomyces sp. NPDC001941]|uniref:ABC transporter ATP-binding protein n=1 Tax=Streptomyces sp. NPDC001941 TaxID=3154659 RepID=UPI00331C7D39
MSLRASVRHGAARALLVLLLTCGQSAAALALPALLGRTLDLLVSGRPADPWLTWTVLVVCAAVALDAVDGVVTGTLDARTTAWLRGRVLRRVIDAGPAGGARPGDTVARLTGNAAQAGTVPGAAAATVAAVLTPLGGLVALFLLDVWTALVVVAGLPLLAVLLKVFVRASGENGARYLTAQGELAERLLEAVRGARTIAASGTHDRDEARVLAPLAELSRQGHLMWRVIGRSTAQAAALLPLLQLAVIAVAGLRLAQHGLTVGGVVAAWRYGVLATGTGVLVGRLNALVRARAATRRLDELAALPVPEHGSLRLPPGPGRLELRGVSRGVLREVDLTVPGGAAVAVVGRSGSGKSQLAELAGRLADPDRGTVLLDGVPLDRLSRGTLRRAVGQAFDRPVLLGETIGDTLAFGTHDPGRRDVIRAARAACADDFVRRLPDGYGTPCARAPLSGGELQRLGLARAFAHPVRLLVLDDATSSLDSATELKVTDALLRSGHTRLITAHRPATAARADAVVWLEGGRVRAVGSHARLWRDEEDYRAVFAAEGERDDGGAHGEGS